jgi:hypothetical protein
MKILYAFDLIELNGDDLRRDPLEVRKATLASIVAKASSGIRFNEHMEGDGSTVFAHACKLGLEGIVSKRKDSAYRSGRRNASAVAGSGKQNRTEMNVAPPGGQDRITIYGPKTDRILAGVLTVASGGWLILILLGYLVSLGWGHVLGLFGCSASASPRCSREKGEHDHAKNSLHFPRRCVDP